jgi:hypothetical protein
MSAGWGCVPSLYRASIAALAEAQQFALGSAASSRSKKPTTKAGATHITATAVTASSHHEGLKGLSGL